MLPVLKNSSSKKTTGVLNVVPMGVKAILGKLVWGLSHPERSNDFTSSGGWGGPSEEAGFEVTGNVI